MIDIDRRRTLGLSLAAASVPMAPEPDPPELVSLWTGWPPGAPRSGPPQTVITDRVAASGFQDRFATKIGQPMMTVFRPARPNGAALLIAPGGGYIRVVIDKEGFEIARHVAKAGVTAFVLRYRLPIDGWADRADVPLQDAQRAMRLIRAGARGFGIDPARVAMLGCSAGGHVTASLATRAGAKVYQPVDEADAFSARPDLAALIYPVIDMALPHAHRGSREALLGAAPTRAQEAAYSPHRHVDAAVSSTFLVHAMDDASVVPENSLAYLAALRAAKVPAEAHLFEEGGHGFGIRLAQGKPAAAWPDLFVSWMERRGFFRAAAGSS